MNRLRVTIVVLIACSIAGPDAAAGAMYRDVEWVRPRIGQRGTTVEVTIQGTNLADRGRSCFSSPVSAR